MYRLLLLLVCSLLYALPVLAQELPAVKNKSYGIYQIQSMGFFGGNRFDDGNHSTWNVPGIDNRLFWNTRVGIQRFKKVSERYDVIYGLAFNREGGEIRYTQNRFGGGTREVRSAEWMYSMLLSMMPAITFGRNNNFEVMAGPHLNIKMANIEREINIPDFGNRSTSRDYEGLTNGYERMDGKLGLGYTIAVGIKEQIDEQIILHLLVQYSESQRNPRIAGINATRYGSVGLLMGFEFGKG